MTNGEWLRLQLEIVEAEEAGRISHEEGSDTLMSVFLGEVEAGRERRERPTLELIEGDADYLESGQRPSLELIQGGLS